eukprot:scaffold1115_cov165-Amphora_coffeaeformis.AAC.1
MIREIFGFGPDRVVLLDDLVADLDVEAVNLLLFSLGAACRNFISVQGGNSQVASAFGGQNFVLVKGRVAEVVRGDYEYYWRYANSTVHKFRKEAVLLQKLKENM